MPKDIEKTVFIKFFHHIFLFLIQSLGIPLYVYGIESQILSAAPQNQDVLGNLSEIVATQLRQIGWSNHLAVLSKAKSLVCKL